MASSSQGHLFSSVISDIKSYDGDDPLRPWVRGIRKIHQSLSPRAISEKLPRFLQKCSQTFESDRRYRNDSRYLAVWIQLMDYVEDARVILRKMERGQIGVKRAKFYIAYALYYEKKKRFKNAEKMYQLGVQKLAEPMGEMQKSYDQFLHRMKRLKQRRTRGKMPDNGKTTRRGYSQNAADASASTDDDDDDDDDDGDNSLRMKEDTVIRRLKEDTMIRKVVGSTVFEEEPKIEDACHHGLVDPTVNLKQAMDDINGMFGKPLKFAKAGKMKKKREIAFDPKPDSAFFILADDSRETESKGFNAEEEAHLFEPTLFTKEAMNEINELFGKPLDF